MINVNDLPEFDLASYLTDDEEIFIFLEDAFETQDPQYIAKAMGIVVRARGLNEVAKASGLEAQFLEQVLSSKDLTLAVLIPMLNALNLELTVKKRMKVD